ncbi:MAG: GNAT family N-acetyltransferase [Acutalibacteraceae bacterium]
MLRLTDKESADEVLRFCSGNAVGARVGALLRAYGNGYGFAMFWEQLKNGNITAAVGKTDGNITVCADENADFEELGEFVRAIGFTALFSDADTAIRLTGSAETGDILRFCGGGARADNVAFDVEPAALYGLLCSVNGAQAVGAGYLPWLSDIMFRKSRDMLRSVGVYENGRLISCALTSAETAEDAVISGVATDAAFRGRCLAKSCVETLAAQLMEKGKKNIFVMTKNQELTGYYEKLGFETVGRWGIHKAE